MKTNNRPLFWREVLTGAAIILLGLLGAFLLPHCTAKIFSGMVGLCGIIVIFAALSGKFRNEN